MDAQPIADAFGLGRATGLSDPVARGELGEARPHRRRADRHRHLTMWLAARDPEARARSLAGVEEFLDAPLLLDDVDRLVAAVTSTPS